MIHAKLDSGIKGIKRLFQKNRLLKRISPVIFGTLAFGWFLIRVIPKPQRASYPCMRIAYPLMSGFVIWLLGITGISASAKFLIRNVRLKKYFLSLLALLIFLTSAAIHFMTNTKSVFAAADTVEPVHIPNKPFGDPQGINPGRVVWAWDPAATNENCTNILSNNDGYFLPKNNNQEVIDRMLGASIQQVTGKRTQAEAWESIFKYFNKQKNGGGRGYGKDETIFIKINMGCAGWSTNSDFSRRKGSPVYAETSPAIILSVLKQLVNVAGVPQEKIIVADPIAHIYSDVFDILHSEFPGVKYGDRTSGSESLGRTLLHPSADPVIFYSDKGSVLKKGSDCIYSEMQTADYIINIAALKAHGCAGITLTGKNHFGSITAKSAGHLHAGLVGERNDQPYRLDYKMYRVQVDLMGSSYLGRNTLLYIVDGLWGGPEATQAPVKWKMDPFNNDWPNSIFISQDQVALESVCFDFLRNEAKVGLPDWHNRPNMGQGVDDYLHQAASSEYWPDNIKYDPDGTGTPIPSLGVHEHWNNPIDKAYTGNIGKKGGIELVRVSP